MEPELLARFDAIAAQLKEVVELSRQTLERVEYVEERLARASAEVIRIGALAGRPVHVERFEHGSAMLFIGRVGIDIANDIYMQLRSLAFGAESELRPAIVWGMLS